MLVTSPRWILSSGGFAFHVRWTGLLDWHTRCGISVCIRSVRVQLRAEDQRAIEICVVDILGPLDLQPDLEAWHTPRWIEYPRTWATKRGIEPEHFFCLAQDDSIYIDSETCCKLSFGEGDILFYRGTGGHFGYFRGILKR
jgi:hypothetical protein